MVPPAGPQFFPSALFELSLGALEAELRNQMGHQTGASRSEPLAGIGTRGRETHVRLRPALAPC